MPWPVHPNGLLGAQGDNDGYRVERSLRFNSGDLAYLNRTLSGTPYTYTLSWWVKRGTLSIDQIMFGSRQGASNPSYVQLLSDNTISITLGVSSTVLTTTRVFRDPSAWYHFVLSVTPSATSYFYVNGEQVGSWTSSATPYLFNSAYTNAIGRYGDSASFYFDGYMAEINFIDGQALTPSSFGETDATTGRWKAKAYSGTYGTNGFYLKFADNSGATAATLGKDSSGNGNNWTPNNFSVTAGAGNDSLVDSPTNYGVDAGLGEEVRGNYATLNPLSQYASTLTNGNLDFSSATVYGQSMASFAVNSGKWYWENTVGSVRHLLGICQAGQTTPVQWGISKTWYSLNGNFQDGDTDLGTPSITYTTNDVIGFALDLSVGTFKVYKNGTLVGTVASGLTGSWHPGFYGNVGGGTSSGSWNFGQRPFAYTAPTGFKALCTTNLATPTIKKPSNYMDVVTYTGTGAAQSVTNGGFQPDFLWIKSRSAGASNTSNQLFNSVAGHGKVLYSDLTNDEFDSGTAWYTPSASGISLTSNAQLNTNTSTYVAWNWKEAAISGMDIVSYTGTGANRTISHNLGVAPKMLVVKARTTAGADQGWPVWHTSIANTTYLQLNSTAGTATGADYWNSTSPTSSVFSVGTNAAVNTSADTYIAYVFAEVDGFSKFGTYTGNGSADGPFIYCGFRPKYVMLKRRDGSVQNWWIQDTSRSTYNVAPSGLNADMSRAERGTGDCDMDIISSGFKMRITSTESNANGVTYIFAAFAESPFKYARAR